MHINIRMAKKSDVKFFFDLANDPITRKNSFYSEFISWEEHIDWFSNKLNDDNCHIYVFSNHLESIGTIRIEKREQTIIGVTVSSKYRGQGLGSKIIKLGCQKFWHYNDDDVYAFIKKDNHGSIRAFEKAGFEFYSKTSINGNDAVILLGFKK